ncbi:MAG: hypothetical protein ABFQ95_05545 [Pseudomonadota bacterium]
MRYFHKTGDWNLCPGVLKVIISRPFSETNTVVMPGYPFPPAPTVVVQGIDSGMNFAHSEHYGQIIHYVLEFSLSSPGLAMADTASICLPKSVVVIFERKRET